MEAAYCRCAFEESPLGGGIDSTLSKSKNGRRGTEGGRVLFTSCRVFSRFKMCKSRCFKIC